MSKATNIQATVPPQGVAAAQNQPVVHRVNLFEFMALQAGKFVGIDFVKKEGSARSLNGRLGVVKHLKGGQNKVEAYERPYLTVFDVKSSGYRTVDMATVSKVRALGQEFSVVG